MLATAPFSISYIQCVIYVLCCYGNWPLPLFSVSHVQCVHILMCVLHCYGNWPLPLSSSSSRYLKSTVGNIQLIKTFRDKYGSESERGGEEGSSKEEVKLFYFWLEFFMETQKKELTGGTFPVRVSLSLSLSLSPPPLSLSLSHFLTVLGPTLMRVGGLPSLPTGLTTPRHS